METICRADLPGAILPLKGALPLAAREGTGRDAGMHLWAGTSSASHIPSVVPDLTRVRFVPQGTKVKGMLVLFRPDSP